MLGKYQWVLCTVTLNLSQRSDLDFVKSKEKCANIRMANIYMPDP